MIIDIAETHISHELRTYTWTFSPNVVSVIQNPGLSVYCVCMYVRMCGREIQTYIHTFMHTYIHHGSWSWRDDSSIKSTCCTCRGLCKSPASTWWLIAICNLSWHQAGTWYNTYIQANIFTYEIKENKYAILNQLMKRRQTLFLKRRFVFVLVFPFRLLWSKQCRIRALDLLPSVPETGNTDENCVTKLAKAILPECRCPVDTVTLSRGVSSVFMNSHALVY